MNLFNKRLSEALNTTPAEIDTRLGELDPDPTFRKIIHGLNNAGYITHASCQGHWTGDNMQGPYLVIKGPKQRKLAQILAKSRLTTEIETEHSNYLDEEWTAILFPQNVNWKRVCKYLQQHL